MPEHRTLGGAEERVAAPPLGCSQMAGGGKVGTEKVSGLRRWLAVSKAQTRWPRSLERGQSRAG